MKGANWGGRVLAWSDHAPFVYSMCCDSWLLRSRGGMIVGVDTNVHLAPVVARGRGVPRGDGWLLDGTNTLGWFLSLRGPSTAVNSGGEPVHREESVIMVGFVVDGDGVGGRKSIASVILIVNASMLWVILWVPLVPNTRSDLIVLIVSPNARGYQGELAKKDNTIVAPPGRGGRCS